MSVEIVYQKQCVISDNSRIATGEFGPCYVLTGYDSSTKITFLAHIDDTTKVESIHGIFIKLNELKVNNKTLNIHLIGGWKDHPESAKWGQKIIDLLKVRGINNVDYTLFQIKSMDGKGINNNTFAGCIIDSKDGEIQFFKEPWKKLQKKQIEEQLKFTNKIFEKNPNLKQLNLIETINRVSDLLLDEPEIPIEIKLKMSCKT